MKSLAPPLCLFAFLTSSILVTAQAADIVHMQKQGTSHAIDGNRGTSGETQQVYLWEADLNNVNQKWVENDQGNGFYSYQKLNTNLCLDGQNSGENRQGIVLWPCGDSNQNQHWKKISTGDNTYRLEKRNSSSFSIDGNNGAENRQGIYLWDSNSSNRNQRWVFTTVGSTTENEDCTRVDSLSELKEYSALNDQCIEMAPGTYTFDTNNVGEGKLFDDPRLIEFSGNNNTYNFDNVTFQYDSNIFRAFGRVDVIEIQIAGQNNVLNNLTMVDIGDVAPVQTALGISLDGEDNLVEGFHMTVRGSRPYGYGDIFGKGSDRVLGHDKHSGVLIRGDRNHLKNTTLIMRSYGHGIFVQGGQDTVVEGCYVEGELSTVADVLAEEGTGSEADEVNFETVWGFDLRDLDNNYHFSLQEDGIRAYRRGITYGQTEERVTTNFRIIDSTVKFMRSAVSIGFADGEKHVENVTSLGTETGFWVGRGGRVIDSYGDTSVGPLYGEQDDRNDSQIELTILDNVVPKIGNAPSIYLAGTRHDITIKDGTSSFDSDISIQVGGKRYAHRWLDGSESPLPNINADELNIDNQTSYPVILEDTSHDIELRSCGSVIDNGSNNSIGTCNQ